MTALPEDMKNSAGEPHLFTVAEYAELGEPESGYTELQEGRVLMSPSPSPNHNHASLRLAMQFVDQLPADLEVIQDVDVDLELVPYGDPGLLASAGPGGDPAQRAGSGLRRRWDAQGVRGTGRDRDRVTRLSAHGSGGQARGIRGRRYPALLDRGSQPPDLAGRLPPGRSSATRTPAMSSVGSPLPCHFR